MKNRRLIFWTMLIALLTVSTFGIIQASHQLQTRLMNYVGNTETETKLNWKHLRFINDNGKRGISIIEVLSYDKNSGDSIFSAKQIIFYANTKIKKHSAGEKIGIYMDSPCIYINENNVSDENTILTDSLQTIDNFHFNELPSIHIKDLCIINRTSNSNFHMINGIDIKAINTGKNYDVSIHYADSCNNRDVILSALLSGNNKNLHIDSAYLDYNQNRVLNFELSLQTYDRSPSDYYFRIHKNDSGKNCIPFKELSNDSHLSFNIEEQSQNGITNRHSEINGHLNLTDSLNLEINHFSMTQNDSDTSFINIVIDGIYGNLLYKNLYTQNQNTFNWEQNYISNFKISNYVINNNIINIDLNGDFEQSGTNKGQLLKSGKFRNSSILQINDNDFQIEHVFNRNQNQINFTSNSLNTVALITFKDFIKEITAKENLHLLTHINIQKINTLNNNTTPKFNYQPSKRQTLKELPKLLKTARIVTDIRIDSITSGSKLICKDNHFETKYANSIFDFKSEIDFENKIQGRILAECKGTKDYIEGSLYSDGLLITEQKNIPIISGNLSLKKDSTHVKAFIIPFHTKQEAFIIDPCILTFEEFMLSLSGNIETESQNLKLGLSAPTNRFKGAAAIILSKKGAAKNKSLQTVILKYNRKNGKTEIKTEVLGVPQQ